MEEASVTTSQVPFETVGSPPASPSGTIPAFRGDGWDGHAHSAPPKSVSPLTPGAVARLKSQLEARISEEHRSRSVEPTRSASPSPMRLAQEFQERINRSNSPSPPPRSQSPRPRASSPLKKDSRITDALGWRQPEVSGPAAAAANFGASPKRTPQKNGGGLVPLSVTPTVAARFERGRAGSRSPMAAVDAAAQTRRAERMAASMPSTSEALREIEAAMRSIEAAESPRAAAAAAAQLRTYDNSFWEPDSRPAQRVEEEQKDAVAAAEPKPRPSAAKALFPVGGSGKQAADVGHIVPRPYVTAMDCAPEEVREPATPEKKATSNSEEDMEEEEEAFPQTPSSLKSAVWGSKLWPAQSPPSLAPAGATSPVALHASCGVPLPASPLIAANPAADMHTTTDAGPPSTDEFKDAAAAQDTHVNAAAIGKNKNTIFDVGATCVGAQPTAPAAPVQATAAHTPKRETAAAPEQARAEEQEAKTGGPRISMWTVVLCVVVTAELALGAWAVSAAIAKASSPANVQGGAGESPPWWWGFPPQWQFESPPFWGRGPPPQHGFWAPSDGGMTNADLDNLVDGSGDRSLQDGGLWRSAMQRFRDLSEKLSQRVSGFVAEASAGDQNETALAIIPRRSATGTAWLRGQIRRLQGAMNRALPLPAAHSGQPTQAEPKQDASAEPDQDTAVQSNASAEQDINIGAGSSTVMGTVLSFLGALVSEMLGLYLLTRLALHMTAGHKRRQFHPSAVRRSRRSSLSQLWQREPWA